VKHCPLLSFPADYATDWKSRR